MEGGREREREGGREGGRERGREGGREGGRERGREGDREGERKRGREGERGREGGTEGGRQRGRERGEGEKQKTLTGPMIFLQVSLKSDMYAQDNVSAYMYVCPGENFGEISHDFHIYQ